MEIQTPYYPIYAHSNPYGIEVISNDERSAALDAFYKKGGCKDLISQCRLLENSSDPQSFGDVVKVNKACGIADYYCNQIMNVWQDSGK